MNLDASTAGCLRRRGSAVVLVLIASVLGAAPGLGASLGPDSFSAGGLHHTGALQALFRGEYEKVDFNREDLVFAAIFQQYLNQYARHCAPHLPAKKVEMTEQECARERVTRNGFGVEISRVCVQYVDIGTGLFAKPELYEAMQEVDRLMAADSVRQSWRLILTISKSDSLDGLTSMAAMARETQSDMQALVRGNDCSGPGLRRFEENLRRFALNQQAIRLDGGPGLHAMMAEAWPAFTSDDWGRLLEALVYDQSRTWALNQYIRGSVHEVTLYPRDDSLRRVEAWYHYNGFNGRSLGVVTLVFDDGKPTCLEFGDSRGVCRTPSRRIVAQHVERVRNRPAAGSTDEASSEPEVAAETTDGTATAGSSLGRAVKPSASQEVGGRAGRRLPTTPEMGTAAEARTGLEPEIAAGLDDSTDPPAHAASPAPRRVLTAVNYVQGIKDACLEVLAGGERREPETSYCFCLSASVGAMSVPEKDVRWFFENFSQAATKELERQHPSLVRPFASCRAQRDARSAG